MKRNVVSKEEWLKARIKLLEIEKDFTRKRDKLAKLQRSLPWVQVETPYFFDSNSGRKSFAQLFEEHSQLIVYHFMYGPEWGDEGCKSCSFWADHYDRIVPHLKQRDVRLITISRAPLEKIQAFKNKMEWTVDWVSSHGSSFNYDFDITMKGGQISSYNYKEYKSEKDSEMPGISIFYKNESGEIFHTYSCFARELETYNTTYRYLDIVPKGRDEDDLPYGMHWVRHRCKY